MINIYLNHHCHQHHLSRHCHQHCHEDHHHHDHDNPWVKSARASIIRLFATQPHHRSLQVWTDQHTRAKLKTQSKHNTHQNTKHNTNISKTKHIKPIITPSPLSAGMDMERPTHTNKIQNISFFNDCNTFALQNKEPIYLQGDRNKI